MNKFRKEKIKSVAKVRVILAINDLATWDGKTYV